MNNQRHYTAYSLAQGFDVQNKGGLLLFPEQICLSSSII
jgi:hypothetical protein